MLKSPSLWCIQNFNNSTQTIIDILTFRTSLLVTGSVIHRPRNLMFSTKVDFMFSARYTYIQKKN